MVAGAVVCARRIAEEAGQTPLATVHVRSAGPAEASPLVAASWQLLCTQRMFRALFRLASNAEADTALQAIATIFSLSTHPEARAAMIKYDATPVLCNALGHPNAAIVAHAASTIESLAPRWRKQPSVLAKAVPLLSALLLLSSDPACIAATARALHTLARDPRTHASLLTAGVVPGLVRLTLHSTESGLRDGQGDDGLTRQMGTARGLAAQILHCLAVNPLNLSQLTDAPAVVSAIISAIALLSTSPRDTLALISSKWTTTQAQGILHRDGELLVSFLAVARLLSRDRSAAMTMQRSGLLQTLVQQLQLTWPASVSTVQPRVVSEIAGLACELTQHGGHAARDLQLSNLCQCCFTRALSMMQRKPASLQPAVSETLTCPSAWLGSVVTLLPSTPWLATLSRAQPR